MSRKAAREMAMKLVFQMELTKESAVETFNKINELDEYNNLQDQLEYIEDCVKGVDKNRQLLDEYIEKYSKGWKINRIAKVDLAIMRLALYEMLYREDVPNAAAIDEAIELAKKYGGDNSPSFINGILGNIIKELKNE
ncbi:MULTISPECIES: transcription antitermination factor NusB [Caloramator]|uniref:Transcription antitermination protein NusB n=1 Tax=Caloramator proteoclasticus DSM 10124 TaxID=1121262 RepID=A0A1M4Y8D8_9CLOT|nr:MULTISPECIES: transcription antitermination factor NusB [Caloramator]SHF01722.1 NusB antitermination factor [Caloramator proteoclasticus DSM 10124]